MHLNLTIARKGCWVISPDYRVSHPQCFCAVGDVVAQRYDVLRDWLWDACHMAGVRWRSRCKGFCSKEGPHYRFERSARKLSSDKQQSTYSWVWISLGDSIPGLYCIAWQSLTHARKCQFEDLCEKERYELCSVQWTFTAETFGKRQTRETCSEATTRFPRASCFEKPARSVPETWGRMYDVLARSANSTRNGTRNWIPVQPRKAQRN